MKGDIGDPRVVVSVDGNSVRQVEHVASPCRQHCAGVFVQRQHCVHGNWTFIRVLEMYRPVERAVNTQEVLIYYVSNCKTAYARKIAEEHFWNILWLEDGCTHNCWVCGQIKGSKLSRFQIWYRGFAGEKPKETDDRRERSRVDGEVCEENVEVIIEWSLEK